VETFLGIVSVVCVVIVLAGVLRFRRVLRRMKESERDLRDLYK